SQWWRPGYGWRNGRKRRGAGGGTDDIELSVSPRRVNAGRALSLVLRAADQELMTYQLGRSILLSQQIDSRLFDVQPEMVQVGKELREIRHAWNVWGNFQFGSRDDQRFGQDLSAKVYGVTVGFDRTFGDRAVAGIAIGGQWMGLSSYKDSLQIKSSGLVVGPYAAVEITPHWVLDAWTGYIYDAFENDLSILSGDYDANRYFATLNITANYDLGWFAVRPKLGVYYSYSWVSSFDYHVSFLRDLKLRIGGQDFHFAATYFSLEIFREFNLTRDVRLVVFVRPGVVWNFLRPNGGDVLATSFQAENTTEWAGNISGGLRALISKRCQIELGGGYSSLGVQDLGDWFANATVSFSF
ncbi:MAG: autotransporter outer membrane beta-barrel domain-containing protein, partial [Terrimicrobiaceae bacterium]